VKLAEHYFEEQYMNILFEIRMMHSAKLIKK